MNVVLNEQVGAELDALREARTYKRFLTLESPQGPVVRMAGRGEVIILSSNNYLGLAGHPEVVRAGIDGLERYGAGTASVRFICGTFEPHHELERALANLSGTEAALTYVSCWNANEAVIPSLTDDTTVILTDELNHASLIDAIRLSRPAKKVIYPHSDTSTVRSLSTIASWLASARTRRGHGSTYTTRAGGSKFSRPFGRWPKGPVPDVRLTAPSVAGRLYRLVKT